MKYLAAYLLLQKSGKEAPSAEEITSVLESVGSEVDEKRIALLLSSLEGKSIADLIAQGSSKLAAVPTGGAAPAAGAVAGGDEEGKEEEEEEKEEEESDDDMGMGLFD
ncbi:DEKNAAC101525 [Brettanomyces naardenensis]|uniref:DEKNAAC101525 n=1 Tax=Brettanomyces naardenensis TaxID=13370 RepID=A0A448YIF7_BRENA|nr:DEKNAAC101525 [Brettanomyces naardenensis]